MLNLTITKIAQDQGSWFLVEASDMALIPRTLTYRMTEQEIQDQNLSEGLEIVPPVLQGIWTLAKETPGGCTK